MYFCVVLCIVCFVTFSVLFVCICVLNYCHRVVTRLQLNISYLFTCYNVAHNNKRIHRLQGEQVPVKWLGVDKG